MFYFSDVTPIPEPSVSLVGLLGALAWLAAAIGLHRGARAVTRARLLGVDGGT